MSALESENRAPVSTPLRRWRYLRNLCIAIVLTMAIFNATVTPTAQAEGTFEAPQIITTVVLVFALTLTTMLALTQGMLRSPGNAKPAVYRWYSNQLALASLTTTSLLILALMAPIVLMSRTRQKAGLAMALVTATAIALTSPFSIPASVVYTN